jgi:hypothetical protein
MVCSEDSRCTPAKARRTMMRWVDSAIRLRQCSQHGGEFALQPWMQYSVGAAGHAFGPQFSGRGVKQREQFGRVTSHVLVRLTRGSPSFAPALSSLRNCLIRPNLIFNPYRQAHRLALLVGILDQLFSPLHRHVPPPICHAFPCELKRPFRTMCDHAAKSGPRHAISR